MTDVSKLLERIDSTVAAARERVLQQQKPLLQDLPERQQRLQRFEEARDQVRAISRPRLEALVQHFGDQVIAKPRIAQTRAEATLEFKSTEAFITLTFSVVPDQEVRNVVVEYDLDVAPVLTVYESHSEFRSPIGNLDTKALETWLDDQILKFVEFYVRMHESEVYGRAEYVEDPVVHIKFPKFAAGATLEHNGKTYYFVDERTREVYARRERLPAS